MVKPAPSAKDIRPRLRLAAGVVSSLRDEIQSGALPPGAQLPTEPKLMERFSVSRTVIREAVAELRAAGLVTPVQGAGVFVADPPDQTDLGLSGTSLKSIPQVLEMLEYRTGLECQAAFLAATRATPAEIFAIRQAHALVEHHVDEGLSAVAADRALHLAIAEATHNPLFKRALKILGTAIIPRSLLPLRNSGDEELYLRSVVAEHRQIIDAISDRDPVAAREAMQMHIGSSQRRYERLALQVGVTGPINS